MVVRVATVAFQGIEARPVDVQVQISNGEVRFSVVGLGDKAVTESRERVRSALTASGLALPARRITVNLAPADMPKEGSHYDLPIALGVMAAIGAIPLDALDRYSIIGELALDGAITAVAGALPAAVQERTRFLLLDLLGNMLRGRHDAESSASLIRAAKAIPDMIRAFADPATSHRINTEILDRPNAPRYSSSGLFLADPMAKLTMSRIVAESSVPIGYLCRLPLWRPATRLWLAFLFDLRRIRKLREPIVHAKAMMR
jgi:hypothetical protein